MPHFILDCSQGVVDTQNAATVMNAVFRIAEQSRLFDVRDIKVRVRTYAESITYGSNDEFIHVFGYVMEGRTAAQKQALSKAIVLALMQLLPEVPIISMNVMDFERATYNNRNTVDGLV